MPQTVIKRTSSRQEINPETKKFEERLLQEKRSLADERDRIRRRTAEVEGSLPNEDAGEDEGTVDLSNSLMAKEIDISVNESLEDTIQDIDMALRKIHEGTYGICDICEGKIAKARLEALPHATLCLKCQSLVEGF
ncbi:MAG: TraR/DksA C4-type zinc finger protein [Armatimonadetes bacterium]|nr:TraR/DksA C4-type zinc finger protein [Armatimonadota bacterium]